MAYVCFGGLISNAEELQDVEDANEDLTYPDEEWGYHTSPLQLAAFQLSSLTQACEAEDMVRAQKEVRGHDLTRRKNAECRFAAITPLALTPILPSSVWLGDVVVGASPINIATRQFIAKCMQDGLHVLELFGGVEYGGPPNHTICSSGTTRSARCTGQVRLQGEVATILPSWSTTIKSGARHIRLAVSSFAAVSKTSNG